jgi:hypothetical protein
MSLTAITDTVLDMVRAERVVQERQFPEREYRRVSRLIDQACERVERVNLAGGRDCPADVSTFVAQLQRQADEPVRRPRTSIEAHDELFRLSCVLLGRPDDDLEIDQEAER